MGDVMIVPIETMYRGTRFRSQLEARWAVFFDRLGLPWRYEVAAGGEAYRPSFMVTIGDTTICHEVKPDSLIDTIRPQRVYLAGKVSTEHDWRGEASPLRRDRRDGVCSMDFDDDPVRAWQDSARSVSLCGTDFVLTGPFPSSCDHGCAHQGESLHMAQTCTDGWTPRQRKIVAACFATLAASDLVCAHISTPDAYGTITEITWAVMRGIPVSLTLNQGLCAAMIRVGPYDKIAFNHGDTDDHDLWFIAALVDGAPRSSSKRVFRGAEEAREAHAAFIAEHTHRNYRLISRIAQSGPAAALTFGDPLWVAQEQCGHWFGKGDRLRQMCRENRAAAEAARLHRFVGRSAS
jgi:hypothetical protein